MVCALWDYVYLDLMSKAIDSTETCLEMFSLLQVKKGPAVLKGIKILS